MVTEVMFFPYSGLEVEIEVEIEPYKRGFWQNGIQITPDEGGVTTSIKSISLPDDDGVYYDVTQTVYDKHPKTWESINTEAQEKAEEEFGGS